MPDINDLYSGTLPDADDPEPDAQQPNDPDVDLDELLADVKSLLSDGEAPAAVPDVPEHAVPEPPQTEPLPPRQQTPVSADDVHIDYEKFYGETPPEPDAAETPEAPAAEPDDDPLARTQPLVFPPLTFYEQSRPAYQAAKRAQYEREREQERLAREQELRAREEEEAEKMRELEQRHKKPRRSRLQPRPAPHPDSEEYAQWLYEQGRDPHTVAQREGVEQMYPQDRSSSAQPPVKKRHGLRNLILILMGLLVIFCAVMFGTARQPRTDDPSGTRRRNCSTIFLAGVDEGGYRTDSMMLVNVDRTEKTISLVSIPRDTLIYCEYSVPKINSAYGWAGGGDDGMQELLTRVEEIVGFRPDGYVVTDLACFEELVDLMRGVTFDVPVEMHYNDPSQDLYIDLSAGEQKLDGAQAMQVMRFRSGYADADLGRVKVQRDFLAAALHQWASVKNAYKLPSAIRLITEHTKTDLTGAQLAWLAESAALCGTGQLTMATMPGSAAWIGGGSYYVLDAAQVADLVNEKLNPYQKEVTVVDLAIRAG